MYTTKIVGKTKAKLKKDVHSNPTFLENAKKVYSPYLVCHATVFFAEEPLRDVPN